MVGIRFHGRARVSQKMSQGNHAKEGRNKRITQKSVMAKSPRWCKMSLGIFSELYHSGPWILCLNFESLYACLCV